jgi:hypothetical protein
MRRGIVGEIKRDLEQDVSSDNATELLSTLIYSHFRLRARRVFLKIRTQSGRRSEAASTTDGHSDIDGGERVIAATSRQILTTAFQGASGINKLAVVRSFVRPI